METIMRLAIKTWVAVSDNPQSAALFGVLDADNPGNLPIPSSDGHWDDVKTVKEREFHLKDDAKAAIAKQGYYLFGPGTTPKGN
jgi:hypothetical protein